MFLFEVSVLLRCFRPEPWWGGVFKGWEVIPGLDRLRERWGTGGDDDDDDDDDDDGGGGGGDDDISAGNLKKTKFLPNNREGCEGGFCG